MKRTTVSERALVLAPRGRDASLAAAILRETGFAAETCPSLPDLIVQLNAGAAFVVVTEEALATADLAPLASWLADQEEWSDMPFVLLTTGGGGLERNPAARRYLDVLGNVTFLERPFHPTTLVSLARSALRGRRRQYDARARLEALRAGEARYRTLFEAIDAGFCIIELSFDEGTGAAQDYRFVEVNPAFAKQTGLAEAEGRWMRDLPPGHEQHWFDIFGQVALTGDAVRFEREAKALGRYYDVHAFRVGPPDARRVAVLFNDITARRNTEERLRESEAKFQAIANSVDQMIWSTRPDGYHDYYNDRWYEYTGAPYGSTDGEAWNGMFHPDDQERAWALWRRSLETGEPYHIEYRLRHRSGPYRWVIGRAQCVRDDEGRIVRWYGTCTDIQDIIEAREVLDRSREELERLVTERTSERNRVWEMSRDLFAIMSFDGYLKAINPAWETTLGFDETTLLARPFPEQVHPDDLAPAAAVLDRLRRGETVDRFEDRLRHADGTWRWIAWGLVPEGDVFYAVGRDVTADKERTEALARAEEQLRQAQKMEAVGQLTGGVAHDFNNLLTIIKSSTDLLRRPGLPEERRRRYVDAISETVDRAAKLTGQLLAFARRQALKPEVFDAAERLRAITDMLRTIVGSRIPIVTEMTCESCLVEADVSQFETALVNMAVNARDAMDGQGKLWIRIEELAAMPPVRGHAGGSGPFLAVSLTDTGMGIPADKLTQIFEPFFTTKEVGKGTGLGLSQVYGFAKQSGGDVAVESEVGRGTTFTLYLPRVAGGIVVEDETRGSPQTEPGRGQRVLVVEDNVDVGTFSTQILQDLGYETVWAANADEALTLLSEANGSGGFDLVFSDVVMPGMSGVDLGEEVRRRYPGLPVVLTSGYSHVLVEDARHGFELLHKPYAVEDLSRALRRATQGRTPPSRQECKGLLSPQDGPAREG